MPRIRTGQTFAAFGHRPYRRLWLGNVIAGLAMMMQSVVTAIVAYDLTGRNGAVGAITLGLGLTQTIFGPFGGAFADRYPRRRMLIIAQFFAAADFLAVGAFLVADRLTLAGLFAGSAILGVTFCVIGPSRQALIAESVPKEMLGNSIAMQQLAQTGSRVLAPFLVGAMVAAWFVGSGGTFIFIGVMLALSSFTIAGLRDVPRDRPRGRSVWGDVRAGFGHVRERRTLAVVYLGLLSNSMFANTHLVLMPGYVEQALGRDPKQVTILYGAAAIGGIASSLGLAGLAGSRHAMRLLLLSALTTGAALALLAAVDTVLLALLAMLLIGAGTSSFFMLSSALVLREADPAQHGRMAGLMMVSLGAGSMAGLPLGLLADATSERLTLAIMAGLTLATAGVATNRFASGATPGGGPRVVLIEEAALVEPGAEERLAGSGSTL